MKIEPDVLNFKFSYGEVVYHRASINGSPLIVTGYLLKPGCIMYQCSSDEEIQYHHDFELTTEKIYAAGEQ